MRRRLPGRCGLAFVLCLVSTGVFAHSFGTPYLMPVPFWMYVYGCAATLILTFVVIAALVRRPETAAGGETSAAPLRPARIFRPWVLRLLQAGAAGGLLLTILAGFIGTTDPAENIGMTLFWVIFLLGFPYLTLFTGDLYGLINPWKRAVEGLERIGWDLSTPRMRYPDWLSYWPVFLLYVALIWVELFAPMKPFTLSCILLLYSAITFVGVATFGRTIWFEKADLFGVFFRLIGKLAPVEYRGDVSGNGYHVWFRLPFSGILNDRPDHLSVVLIVLFMLSSTTYDSIHETALWAGVYWTHMLVLLQPLWGTDLGKAQEMLMGGYLAYRQTGLLVFPFLYFALYVLVLIWAKALTQVTIPVRDLALVFCYSLLPIALAYHFTHYFSFLILQAQSLPALLSDPFGWGWDWLGVGRVTAPPTLNMAVVWHTQVAVLLLGHLVSIYLAHRMAIRTFLSQVNVIVSQVPVLLLMVVYTWSGLWILFLPLASE